MAKLISQSCGKLQPAVCLSREYVTGPGKTGLIYTKYMCLYYGTYLQFCVYYPESVSFIEFLMDLCTYDEILDIIQTTDKKLLQFKVSKSGQILRVDKTCFPRPGHIYRHLKATRTLVDVWQASETSHSKSSRGNLQHQYLAELLVNMYSYRLMVKSVSCYCVRGSRLFSDLVTYFVIIVILSLCMPRPSKCDFGQLHMWYEGETYQDCSTDILLLNMCWPA